MGAQQVLFPRSWNNLVQPWLGSSKWNCGALSRNDRASSTQRPFLPFLSSSKICLRPLEDTCGTHRQAHWTTRAGNANGVSAQSVLSRCLAQLSGLICDRTALAGTQCSERSGWTPAGKALPGEIPREIPVCFWIIGHTCVECFGLKGLSFIRCAG